MKKAATRTSTTTQRVATASANGGTAANGSGEPTLANRSPALKGEAVAGVDASGTEREMLQTLMELQERIDGLAEEMVTAQLQRRTLAGFLALR